MKLTETPPTHCSSCFGQYPDRRHVDFEVAWEGPTFKDGIVGEDGEVTNSITVSIDDLVLCDECLAKAAALLGLVDPEEFSELLDKTTAERDELLEKNRGLERYVNQLKATIAADPVAA